jgi:hypothetical protein
MATLKHHDANRKNIIVKSFLHPLSIPWPQAPAVYAKMDANNIQNITIISPYKFYKPICFGSLRIV